MVRWAAVVLLIGCTTQEAAKGPPCPRAVDPHGLRAASKELLGQLQRPVFHCEDDPHELGCALIAKGSWSLKSVDDSFESTGWFESADSIGPLTF